MNADSALYIPPYKADDQDIVVELNSRFGAEAFTVQATRTGMPVLWVARERLIDVLTFLRNVPKPYVMLYDLHGVDERLRTHRRGLPGADFSVFYHLMSLERNSDVMIKVALSEGDLNLPTATRIWPNANWYEREVWDMYGITFTGHPHLTRMLMPPTWEGHPLRKDYPARATEFDPYALSAAKQDLEQEALRFKPEDWGMKRHARTRTSCSSTSARTTRPPTVRSASSCSWTVKRSSTAFRRSATTTVVPRRWPSVNPGTASFRTPTVSTTSRCDEQPAVRALGREARRHQSAAARRRHPHHDVGVLPHPEPPPLPGHLHPGRGRDDPVFFTFTDRQRAYKVVEAITGFRLHPAWYRIGGVAHDLPRGWDKLVREFLDWMPKRLDEYETAALKNSILRGRTIGVAQYNTKEALEWGTTGAGLRATGCDFDLRKARPYSGYENFEFEVPLAANGDAYDRCMVKMGEMRQSLRIIEQCLKNMPEGPYKADHPLTTPPPKERTLQHIETLITHFLQVSWGPVMPANEAFQMVEATKGINSYYLTSDGSTMSYRTRIRTPSFAHLQQIPSVINGSMIADLIAYLGSIDFVMADVDR